VINEGAISQSPLLSKKIKTDFTVEQHYGIKYVQQSFRKEVINEKLAQWLYILIPYVL